MLTSVKRVVASFYTDLHTGEGGGDKLELCPSENSPHSFVLYSLPLKALCDYFIIFLPEEYTPHVTGWEEPSGFAVKEAFERSVIIT